MRTGHYKKGELYNGLPVMECIEGGVTPMTVFFLIWGLGFGGLPLYALLHSSRRIDLTFMFFIFAGFVSVFYGFLRPLVVFLAVKACGEEMTGILVGYTYDRAKYNGQSLLCMMVKISTDEGDRILRYQTMRTKVSYPEGSLVKILYYRNLYYIDM